MGGSSTKTSQTEYDGIIVQSSLMGISIPKGWGTNKLGCNLVDYQDFSAKKVNQSGKGGGAAASYDYYATLVLAICQGPIYGIRTIYKDSAIFTAQGSGSKEVNGTTITISAQTPLQAAGLSVQMNGSIGQSPWSYMSTAHPTHAIGYSGICYVAAENYNLNSSATTPNHNFEVQFAIRATINGTQIDDALAADIVNDMLPDVPRWPSGAISDLTNFRNYTIAQGLWISPIATNGREASDLLDEILKTANADCLWSEGLLKIVPYGDVAITANGVTWTPNLTPIYGLTWDDIIPNSANDDPIQWDLVRTEEAYNYVQVSFSDRSLQYSDNVATAVDQANINAFTRRQSNPVSLESICDANVANTLAQLMVQRSANVRRTCEFKVSALFGLLDPMDLITVPLRNGGTRLVRIVEANETEDDEIEIKAEEMLVGSAHAPEYSRQTALGAPTNTNIAPGDTNTPVIINPPRTITGSALEVWIGASGGANWGGCQVWMSLDNSTYSYMGDINAPANYGALTTSLPAGSDPDTSHTPSVSLALSGGSLASYSQADADAFASLCLIISGSTDELISFETATLTGANTYQLSYLRRALYSTPNEAHSAGDVFVRIDGAIFKMGYQAGQIGQTCYIKLAAFNSYGNAVQDLDLVTYYEFTLTPGATPLFDLTQVQGALAELNAVSTPQIMSNAVTLPSTSSSSTATSGTGSFYTYFSETVDAVTAGQLNIFAQVQIIDGGGHDASYHASGAEITVDGTVIEQYQPTGSGAAGVVLTLIGSLSVASGNHTVDLNAYCQTGDQIGYLSLITEMVYR